MMNDCPLCGRWDCECEDIIEVDEDFELFVADLIKRGLL